MKRCKYINEFHVVWFRNPLQVDGLAYSNPTSEQLDALGYMPFRDSLKPDERQGFVLAPRYHVAGGEVIRKWEYEKEEKLP